MSIPSRTKSITFCDVRIYRRHVVFYLYVKGPFAIAFFLIYGLNPPRNAGDNPPVYIKHHKNTTSAVDFFLSFFLVLLFEVSI
ncbi:hypothetical protein HanIR_Chr09g0428021 [Helianthus annuus]|nr:hypothetical protein HanIR_Chr09g0428021 [Helianthus annuus]